MERKTENIQVVIAVKTRIYREGIGQLLAEIANIQVLDMVSTEQEARRVCLEKGGGDSAVVVLLDVSMQHSLALIKRLNQELDNIRFVALAMTPCREQMATFAAEGVVEFVTHDDSLDDLKHCIYAALDEGFWCSKRVASLLLSQPETSPAKMPRRRQADMVLQLEGLSKQQVNVLQLIESGMSNKEIGRQLNIETATVKNHVHQILQKLNVSNRGEAAARFRRDAQLPSMV